MEPVDPAAQEVLAFWFRGDERDPRWFRKDPAFDDGVRSRFLALHERGAAGELAAWRETPGDCLALIVVLDQFSRNMFRGTARAFATDAAALQAARHAVARGHDRDMRPAQRIFVYLPFQHSEALEDQRRSCELNAPLGAFAETFDVPRFAEAHRAIIERFGRFPHRNAALGRLSTAEEIEFLKQPGSGF